MRLAQAFVVVGFWVSASHAALGQGLSDPMRPPNVLPGAQGVETEAPSTLLQSVLLSRGRRVAVINGETVPLGGKFGDAVVVKISESEVVLKYADRTEVLKLFGAIERKPVRAAARAAGVPK